MPRHLAFAPLRTPPVLINTGMCHRWKFRVLLISPYQHVMAQLAHEYYLHYVKQNAFKQILKKDIYK